MTVPLPPQAPERGVAARLLGRFHVTGVFWYRFHRWGMAVLPESGKRLLLPGFVALFWLTLRRIRRAVARNLEAPLGRCGWFRRQRRIWLTFHQFAWCLSERYERLNADRSTELSANGVEWWNEAMESDLGVVLVTAHLGHWELGSLGSSLHSRKRIHVVREEEISRQAQEFVSELLRRQSGDRYRVHFASADRTDLGLELLERLRRGEVVALQGDRPRTGGRTLRVELFGRPYELPEGPAALARAAGVPLLPVFVFRRGRRRAEVCFRPPIAPRELPERSPDLRRMAERFAGDLEWAIRSDPHQWFCFRELWPEKLTQNPGRA